METEKKLQPPGQTLDSLTLTAKDREPYSRYQLALHVLQLCSHPLNPTLLARNGRRG